ncbi:histidine phosphatase family protein [Candidatus Woesearchaeota archaeon]|nr:histidine phosphatase family protein [Candidatus Woesearchaeota archaeon]
MLRLIKTRHGETQYNIENRIQGGIDTELTPHGIRQAEMLADHFRDTPIDYVVSGTLKRQAQTAGVIARPRGISVVHDEGLNERDWGRFNGRYEHEVDTGGIPLTRYLFYMVDPNDDSNPKIEKGPEHKGETIEEMMRRIGLFYDRLVDRYVDATMLIVGSQFSNAYLLNHVLGIPPECPVLFAQENMCINEIRVYPKKDAGRPVEVVDINFMEHVHYRDGSVQGTD